MSARRASRAPARAIRRALAAAAFAVGLAGIVAAQSLEQPRAVIASGGGSSADPSGALRISGTFAEPVTGSLAVASAGGKFALAAGFWADERAPRDGTFRDQFENPPAPAASTEQDR